MKFESLITGNGGLIADTLASIGRFQPELWLCATIVLILLLRVIPGLRRIDSFYIALAGSAVALWFAGPWRLPEGQIVREPFFTGMLVYDSLTVYFRVILLLFAVLFVLFTRVSGIPDRDAGPDFYSLVLGGTLGMCIMASANHMLMVFLGIEMASVPSYVLAGILKGRRQSSEAALKYAVFGAGTAGIMLYGISLLAGVLGSVHIPTMAVRLAALLQPASLEHGVGADTQMVLVLSGLMIMVGLAFKLSAVPFHFWCPDVFEGAAAEIGAFLSVASKAAALALLVRVVVGFGYISHGAVPKANSDTAALSVADRADRSPVVRAAALASRGGPPAMPATSRLLADAQQTGAIRRSPHMLIADVGLRPKSDIVALNPVREYLSKLLAFIAVITCTFGNLAAYGQTNIKRLLAYSTIAHAGYMIMPVAAAMALAGTRPLAAEQAISALAFYVAVYLFMNLGAFAIVAFLRNVLHSEQIDDYAGLIRRFPVVVVCFSLILISLIGIPPLAGFAGKFLIFWSLVEAQMWTVLVIGGLNTAISLFYYIRVVQIMTMEPEPVQRLPVSFPLLPGTFVVALTIPVVFFGIWWSNLQKWALDAATNLFT